MSQQPKNKNLSRKETSSVHNDFADLQIRIYPKNESGYLVEMELDGGKKFPSGYVSANLANWSPDPSLEVSGQKLFKVLFADPVLSNNWAEAYGHSRKRRIRLWIDINAYELHSLPWELLHDGQTLLAANVETPFSRYLPISREWGSAVQTAPVRVLVAISNPDNLDKYELPRLDIEAERKSLQRIATEVEGLELTFLEAPITLERLEDALQDGYHILHYLGHGKFSKQKQKAALYLQDDSRGVHLVYDKKLANMLARQGVQVRLVVLTTCQSAVRSTTDAFLGLAPQLVSIGVPAVLAMQDNVSIISARKFSERFYQRLLTHGQVDLATNQARSKLVTADRPDAAVPVLFMRLKSGRLWEKSDDSSENTPTGTTGNSQSDINPAPIKTGGSIENTTTFKLLVFFVIMTTCIVLPVYISGYNIRTFFEDFGSSSTITPSSSPQISSNGTKTPIQATDTPITALPTATVSPTPTKQVVPYTPTIETFKGYKYAMIPKPFNEGDTPVADFWMGVYEVTNEQFAAYLNAQNPSNQCRGGYVCVDTKSPHAKIERSNGQWLAIEGHESHPVIEVTWTGANEFCEAVGGRLPTSAEWTKAAGWHPVTKETTSYSWGNEGPSTNLANYGNQYEGTQVINAYPDGRSIVGVFNMSGNVWEFVADTIGTNRIWRGGGWDSPASQIKITSELRKSENATQNNLGFRCAKS